MPVKNFGNNAPKDVSEEVYKQNFQNSMDDMKRKNDVVMPKDVDRDDFFNAVRDKAEEFEKALKGAEIYPWKRTVPDKNDGKVEGRPMNVGIYTNKDNVRCASITFRQGSDEKAKELKISLMEQKDGDKLAVVPTGVYVSTDTTEKKTKDGTKTFRSATGHKPFEAVSDIPKSFENIAKKFCELYDFKNPEREELSKQEITMRLVSKKMKEVNDTFGKDDPKRMYIGDVVKDSDGNPVKETVDGKEKNKYQQIFDNVIDGNQVGYYFTLHNRQSEQLRVYLDMDGNINHVNYADWNGYDKEKKEFQKGYSGFAYDLNKSADFNDFTVVMNKVVAELGDKYVAPPKPENTKTEDVKEDEFVEMEEADIAELPFA